MVTTALRLDIVSAEKEIFSGEVTMVFASGYLGDLGIAPGHTPLITSLKPGDIRATFNDNEEEVFYVRGGMLEVQPNIVTVLADTVVRARDIDEAQALEAKEKAEKALSEKGSEVDFAKASSELAEAIAQIR
ncbi:F0F1 ATP synthase subunit epsilon, partial [Gammaproteobacteria bacterium]|nr:F0F1 ATP synthase subunit epsilon [Gammaproteobacteria bacterium]